MRKGIALVSLAIVIVVMVILAGIVIVSGIDSIENARINTFTLEILNIQNAVDEYYFRYEKYPVGADKILNMSDIKSGFTNQFAEENIQNNQIAFKIVDISLIGINDTEFGNSDTSNDVYVVSEITGKVYYLEGVLYEDIVYYTLTNELYSISNIIDNTQVTSNDVKVYDVVFTPSNKDITNQTITVTVKIPKSAIINSITTTNEKSISEVTVIGRYKQIEINATSEDKTGNYKVTVNYTYNNVTKTAEYTVGNYNDAVPTVTYTEETEGDLKTVIVTVNNNGSEIKKIKYEEKLISKKTYFEHYGKQLTNNKLVVHKDQPCSIYIETTSGIGQVIYIMPETWKSNVTNIVSGVPIPKGFVASFATGENTKNGGLVIYEGTEPVTDANVETAKRTRNQYVWVPVEDFSKFIIQYVNSKSNTLGTPDKHWEVVLDTVTNMPLSVQDTNYMTSTTLKEVQAMYASVKTYKGFYIARYEAGIDTQRTSDNGVLETNVYSMMGKIPYNFVPWTKNDNMAEDTGGAVEVARNIYPETNDNYGVVSTLIYGVQWDRTLAWWLEVEAKDGDGNQISVIDSTAYGNYSNRAIAVGDLNAGAKYAVYSSGTLGTYQDTTSDTTKVSGTAWALTTGALKAASVNNTYDMAGNMYEWTMQGYSSARRDSRGGSLKDNGSDHEPTFCAYGFPNIVRCFIGLRPALYIKQ